MDNSAPSSQQRPTQQPVVAPTTQSVASDVKTEDTIEEKPKQEQISGGNKEFGPMMSASPSEQGGAQNDDEEEIKVAKQEVMLGQKITPSKEVPLSQELKEAGVEQGSDVEQEIPTVVQRAGMRVTSADSNIPVSALPAVKLPINYQHAKQLDKRSKIKESIKWLARFIERQWGKVKAAEENPKKEV